MGHGAENDTLARLSARLDTQERVLGAQEEELAVLRATLARLQPEERSATPRTAPAGPSVPPVERAPASRRTPRPSRRTLLKGAGAALFTTALLATGDIIPVTPFRVAAATPPPPGPSGPMTAIATTPDTLYQTFVGTDFQPETTSDGEVNVGGPVAFFGAGPIQPATLTNVAFSARLHLPQGATITEVIFYVLNNSPAPMFVDIGAYDAADSTFINIGLTPFIPSSASGQAISVPVLPTVVDNAQQSYVLEWNASDNRGQQQLYGARVGYTLPGSAQLYGSAQAGIGAFGLSTGGGIGVQGRSDSATGRGVKGVSDAGFPLIGTVTGAATINAGALGIGTAGPGMQGQSTGGHGVVGLTTATDGQHAATLGYVFPPGNAIGVRGSVPSGATGLAGVFDGDVTVNGAFRVYGSPKSAAVKHPTDNTYRLLYCEEAPESWFADYGEGTLAADKADITLDPDFAALVHTDEYHVFVTAHGPQHLHIAQRSATGFTVVATALGGAAGGPKAAEGGGTFSWRVVAKRKDITGERLAKVPPPTPLKAVTPFTEPETPKPPAKKP